MKKQFHFYQMGHGRARFPVMVFTCPVCGLPHAVRINSPEGASFKWNGDKAKPTITPMFRTNSGNRICRIQITAGEVIAGGKTFQVPVTEGVE